MEELLNFLDELQAKAYEYIDDADENDTTFDNYIRYNEEHAIAETVFLVKKKIKVLQETGKL